jgi:NifU-like protein involved in Fe-S cluster formation
MMPAYIFFLLFKIDFAKGPEYRQQIKTFRLKYIFSASKTIRTAKCGDEINLTWNFGTTNLRKLA